MITYALISNGKHNPFLKTELPDHMRYPIAQNYKGQKDLDYTSLLLGDGYIIDGSMYDDVVNSSIEYLKPMKKSLEVLYREGILEIKDYSNVFKEYNDRIAQMTESYLADLDTWLRLEQSQWKKLKPELFRFQEDFGNDNMYSINTGNIGIENWLIESDQKSNNVLREQLYNLFEGNTDIETVGEDNARGAMKFIVSQIVMSDLISYTSKAPVLDWDDCADMYKEIYQYRWHNYADELELKTRNTEAFKIMQYTVPDLLPCRIEDVVHFIHYDNAVKSLRETLLQTIESGNDLDDTWMARYLGQVLTKDLAHNRLKSHFGIGGTISSLFPIPWPISIIPSAVSFIAGETIDNMEPEYNWIYALQSKK